MILFFFFAGDLQVLGDLGTSISEYLFVLYISIQITATMIWQLYILTSNYHHLPKLYFFYAVAG